MIKSSIKKFLIAAIMVCALIMPGFAGDEPTPSARVKAARQTIPQALKAYKEKDFKSYLEIMQQIVKLRPNHPTLIYNLAGAYALNGNTAEALKQLKIVAEMGMSYRLAADDDFKSLKDSPAFNELVKQFEANQQPINSSQSALTIPEKGLITEGIAYDAATKTFYLSSVHRRKIVAVNEKGETKDFATAESGLWAVMGMRVDAKRRHLWVASASLPQMVDFNPAEKGATAIFKFDLATGKLLKKYPLTTPSEAGHTFGDLVLDQEGNVYTTDSSTPALYRINRVKDELELVMEGGPFVSPQGLDFSEDGKHLFIADYSTGVFVVDPATKQYREISHAENVELLGIDGLYYHKGSLIGIQNGVNPHRVVRLFLNKGLDRVERLAVVEANNPVFNEPTLGVLVGEQFYYIANSQWELVDENGKLAPLEKFASPVVLKHKLND